jgi:hypothetical protein
MAFRALARGMEREAGGSVIKALSMNPAREGQVMFRMIAAKEP